MAVSLVRGVSLSVLIFKRGFFLSLLVSASSGEKNCKSIYFFHGLPVVSYHDILTGPKGMLDSDWLLSCAMQNLLLFQSNEFVTFFTLKNDIFELSYGRLWDSTLLLLLFRSEYKNSEHPARNIKNVIFLSKKTETSITSGPGVPSNLNLLRELRKAS